MFRVNKLTDGISCSSADVLCFVRHQAAHYIGRGCNVVLCIQNVSYSSLVDTEMVIAAACYLPTLLISYSYSTFYHRFHNVICIMYACVVECLHTMV